MMNRITGILLSAGLSGRMNNFKPMLKLDNGKTFIQTITEKLYKVCDEIIIVTGFRSEEIIQHVNADCTINKIKFVFNNEYKKGMFSSLQAGLQISNSQWYLYHFVDQPSLPVSFYSDFVKQIDLNSNWIQPTFNDRRGHPILFDEFAKHKILEMGIEKTLRDAAQDKSIKKKFWECDTELIFQDIDTVDDYRKSNSFD